MELDITTGVQVARDSLGTVFDIQLAIEVLQVELNRIQ